MHLQRVKRGNVWRLLVALAVAIVLIQSAPRRGVAQTAQGEPQLVTAYNEAGTCGDQVWRLTIEVWNVGAEGGEAYAQAVLRGYDCINGQFGDAPKELTGTFSGGPNGTVTFEGYTTCQFTDGKTVQCGGSGGPVFIVQNPEAFDAGQAPAVTSEFIYTTYGIRVQDTFGDDQWEQKSWSDQELILLNDVLKELPPGMLQKLAGINIIRSKVKIKANGQADPTIFGTYYPCGSPPEKDCASAASAIRIFDRALGPMDFSDDPDGTKEFKGTILHELTHVLQYTQDNRTTYLDPHASPLVENYMDAIRPITDINDPGFNVMNGWTFGEQPPGTPPNRWKLLGKAQENQPPTNYGNLNPCEDMSESVMMYVYEPEKLKATSLKRYNFIRDQIFEGIEYTDGAQQKP
jgi:hypothetical protein